MVVAYSRKKKTRDSKRRLLEKALIQGKGAEIDAGCSLLIFKNSRLLEVFDKWRRPTWI